MGGAVGKFLEFEHGGEEGIDGFNDHGLVPPAAFTDFEVLGIARFGMEALVSQHDHLVFDVFDHAVEDGVVQTG